MSATPKGPTDPRGADTLPEQPHPRIPHPVPEAIGPYRVIEIIGEGGMGVVYKAEQREPVRRVAAVKVIKVGMDTKEVLARFDAERQALALMSHPNVAKVFEAGFTGSGGPYFAMEYVPGESITAYCDTQKLTTRERLELFIPVCQAVQHAHQKGIIHRDLKPSNILITLFDGNPVPKVIDFGVAKATSIQLTQKTLFTQSGTVIGTLEYMSPEQATSSGLDVDTRTDVYSLGVILYQLLTGSLPFEPETLRKASMEMVANIIQNTDPPKPSQRLTGLRLSNGKQSKLPDTAEIARRHRTDVNTLRRELQGDLDWIVLKAMEKDRTRRFESASAFAADLRRHLDDEPVEARPPSTLYRVEKFVTRHRFGVFAAVAIFAALNAGLAAATYGLVKAKKATANAVSALQRANEQTAIARQKELEANDSAQKARQANDFSLGLLARVSSPNVRPTQMRSLDEVSSALDRAALSGDTAAELKARTSLAHQYVNFGLYTRAIPHLRARIDLDHRLHVAGPQLRTDLNELADALIINERYADAEGPLDEARSIISSSDAHGDAATAWTLDLLGIVESTTNRWTDAKNHFDAARRLRNSIDGNVSGDERRLADSLAHEGNVLIHNGDPRGYELIRNAQAEYEKQFLGNPNGLTGPLRKLASDARRRGDWEKAVTILYSIKLTRQTDPALFSEQIESCTGWLRAKPDNAFVLSTRAAQYGHLGRFDDAVKDYTRAIKLDPGDVESWFRYLTLLLNIKDFDNYRAKRHEALQCFATTRDPEQAYQIAKSSFAYPIDGDDLKIAMNLMHLADQLHRRDMFMFQGLGMAEFRSGEYAIAMDYFSQSRRNTYPTLDVVNDLYTAMCWFHLGDKERARTAFEAAFGLWERDAPVPGVDDLGQFREYALCLVTIDQARQLISP